METPKPERLVKNLVAYVLIAQTTAIVTLFGMYFSQMKSDIADRDKRLDQSIDIIKSSTDALNQHLNWMRFNEHPIRDNKEVDK